MTKQKTDIKTLTGKLEECKKAFWTWEEAFEILKNIVLITEAEIEKLKKEKNRHKRVMYMTQYISVHIDAISAICEMHGYFTYNVVINDLRTKETYRALTTEEKGAIAKEVVEKERRSKRKKELKTGGLI